MNHEFFAREEVELWKTIKQSRDASEVEEAKNILIEKNLGLLNTIAKKYSQKYELDFDDLFQEGYFGLKKAVDEFDPMKGYRFSSFAYPIIENKIRDSIRKVVKDQNRTMPLDGKSDREDDIPLIEKLEDRDTKSPIDEIIDREEKKERDRQIEEILNKLKPKERLVLQRKSETTYKKLSGTLGVSSERVRQINKKALRKVKFESIEKTVERLQDLGIDYYNEIEPVLISVGIICDEELTVGDKVSDEGIRETIRKIEEEEQLMKNRVGLTEEQRKAVEEMYKDLKDNILNLWEWNKGLKMRGNRRVYPDKTKPRREDVSQAVTIMVALLEEKTGSPHWGFIEQILYPYCPQVKKGGNIEFWYYKREKEALKFHQPPVWMLSRTPDLNSISREERKKFILWNFRNTGRYGIAIPPGS